MAKRDPFLAWLRLEISSTEAALKVCRMLNTEETGRPDGCSDYYDELQRRGGERTALKRVLEQYLEAKAGDKDG